jgi:N6-adenosine-specific RNA methylase IME4
LSGIFKAIIIDVPWPFAVWSKATGNGRSAESHYRTMDWKDLAELGPGIDAVASDDCAMFLWACRPSQHQALDLVLHAWNEGLPKKRRWAYKTEALTWVKTSKNGKPSFGLGYWTRANTEPLLLFTRGKVTRIAKNVPQVLLSPRLRHSEKPEEAQDRVERLVDGPYLELFARRSRPGWHCEGFEIDGRDMQVALANLAPARLLHAA